MFRIVNRAKMTTATTGTGAITLGAAVAGFQSFADAGVTDGDQVWYTIEEGDEWEVGVGTYTASGTLLARAVEESSNADAAVDLQGSAVVYVTATATKTDTDNTVGALLKVGDFGIGALAVDYSGSVDSTTLESGEYFATASSTGTKPASYGLLKVQRGNGGARIRQTWAREATDGPRVWERFYSASAWSAWVEILKREEIIGTVSQSGGAPTGAIIEQDSNANGEYIRWADGTQICHARLSSSNTGAVTWTYPISFNAVPQVLATANTDLPRIAVTNAAFTATCAFSVYNTAGARANGVSTSLMAIGRWF